jgi:vitamin B12/bleomycin/antimicrobial peptide transport system ATP-binding/permease protein
LQLSKYCNVLGEVGRLIKPYFDSEERWIARSLLSATICLNLALVGLNVLLSFNSNLMYTALQEKNVSDFFHIIFLFKKNSHGYLIPGFCEIAALFVPIAMYGIYIKQLLELRWRRWLTTHLLGEWLDQRVYYRMGLLPVERSLGTENPDQRIQEDIDNFTKHSIEISVGLLSNTVTLISFIGVLWNLSGSTRVFGTAIPGYIVWIALLYAILGTHHPSRRPAALILELFTAEARGRLSVRPC